VEEGAPLFSSPRDLRFLSAISSISFGKIEPSISYGDRRRANGRSVPDPVRPRSDAERAPSGEEFVTLDNYYADGEISVLGHSFTTSGYASPFLEWISMPLFRALPGLSVWNIPAVTSPAYPLGSTRCQAC